MTFSPPHNHSRVSWTKGIPPKCGDHILRCTKPTKPTEDRPKTSQFCSGGVTQASRRRGSPIYLTYLNDIFLVKISTLASMPAVQRNTAACVYIADVAVPSQIGLPSLLVTTEVTTGGLQRHVFFCCFVFCFLFFTRSWFCPLLRFASVQKTPELFHGFENVNGRA